MVAGRLFILCALLAPPAVAAQQAKLGKPAPDFVLAVLGEAKAKMRLSQLRGHPVVISFWATWCPPCRKEMPELATVFEANRNSDLAVLAVNEEALEIDVNSRPVYRKKAEYDSNLKAFLRAVPLPFPVLLDDRDGGAWNRFSSGRLHLPAIFFVDAAGLVRAGIRSRC